jgi:hypothetical protein
MIINGYKHRRAAEREGRPKPCWLLDSEMRIPRIAFIVESNEADDPPGQTRRDFPGLSVSAAYSKPLVLTDTTFAAEIERSPLLVLVDMWRPGAGHAS